jgi:hypothetical protein
MKRPDKIAFRNEARCMVALGRSPPPGSPNLNTQEVGRSGAAGFNEKLSLQPILFFLRLEVFPSSSDNLKEAHARLCDEQATSIP